MTEPANTKTKIAILGGGIGAMTAAFGLTDQPGWQDRYEITVYQMGWRLGGKCASGRNQEHGERIEEHGLHIWLGFYENSFRMMRKCYREWGRPPESPLATCEDAFKKHSRITVMEERDQGWIPWVINFPTNEAVPGEGDEILEPWDYLRMLLHWMVQTHDQAPASSVTSPPLHPSHSLVEWVQVVLKDIVVEGTHLVEKTVTAVEAVVTGLAGAATHLHRALHLAQSLPDDPKEHRAQQHQAILWLVQEFVTHFLRDLEKQIDQHDGLRRRWILLRLGAAVVSGMLKDSVLFHGFDALDQYDLAEWLQRHGATDRQVYWSAPVRGIYELVFGYEQGNTDRPNLAAGVGLRGCLRMFFGYKGAVCWKMQSGMGDTIFAPLYEVLKRRGVQFQFFHRVKSLGLSPDQQSIDTIGIGVQATVKDEVLQQPGGYQPLRMVKDSHCWPSAPQYEQLVEGEDLKAPTIDLESAWSPWPDVAAKTLRRGQDFDLVVLGISLGALPHICPELIAANPRWRDMVDHVKTIPTLAFQLWLNRTIDQLGWVAPERALMSSYVEPFDTWADMSQLLDREDWPAGEQVQNVSYFCGPMQDADPLPAPPLDPGFPARQLEQVKQQAIAFLKANVQPFWPSAIDPDNPPGLNWDLLVAPADQKGDQRFHSQYCRVNVQPSERYVLSVKGSTKYRLKSGESGFRNLYLAGDWTANGLNAGCVEAATISGLQASAAICGHPTKIIGASDHAP